MNTYEELSIPFKTIINNKRNPLYQPVYPSLKEAVEAKERVLNKPRSASNDYVWKKINNEIYWFQTASQEILPT